MKHLDLFSGIGGFALAVDTVWHEEKNEHIFCDNDKFCQAVLKKHWPESPIYGDIRTLTYADFRQSNAGNESKSKRKTHPELSAETRIDILTGGFPCQPFSLAGRRQGTQDDRFLWPEMFRVIRDFKPPWVIAENVRGLLTQGGGLVFEQVCADLESIGYEVQPIIIPAVAVNAPHRRDRVWFIANRKNNKRRTGQISKIQETIGTSGHNKSSGNDRNASNSNPRGVQRHERKSTEKRPASRSGPSWNENWIKIATELCRVDDGLSKRLDRNPRLTALGNAIVPQVAEEILKAIKEIEG